MRWTKSKVGLARRGLIATQKNVLKRKPASHVAHCARPGAPAHAPLPSVFHFDAPTGMLCAIVGCATGVSTSDLLLARG